MNQEAVERGLQPVASIPERIQAFVESGLPKRLLAETFDVSPQTITNWQEGVAKPRPANRTTIDDIRFVMEILIAKGLQADQAANIVGRRFNEPPHERFIEFIRRDPDGAIERISKLRPRHPSA